MQYALNILLYRIIKNISKNERVCRDIYQNQKSTKQDDFGNKMNTTSSIACLCFVFTLAIYTYVELAIFFQAIPT